MKHTCGHDAPEPRNMGRGQARQKRLAQYFARPCLNCKLAAIRATADTLTDTKANPLTQDQRDAYYNKRMQRIKYDY